MRVNIKIGTRGLNKQVESLTEDTVQELLRIISRNNEYIWSPCQKLIDELEAILLLKSKGYKILKPKTWEEV